MAATDILATVRIVPVCCYKCGVWFGMDSEHHANALRLGSALFFFCPNGHSQCYTKSEATKLREQLDAQKKLTDDARKATDEAWNSYYEMSERRQAVQRQLVATRGVVTRTKKRIAAGKCPCCKEKFADLGAHMQGAHPGYGADTDSPPRAPGAAE